MLQEYEYFPSLYGGFKESDNSSWLLEAVRMAITNGQLVNTDTGILENRKSDGILVRHMCVSPMFIMPDRTAGLMNLAKDDFGKGYLRDDQVFEPGVDRDRHIQAAFELFVAARLF